LLAALGFVPWSVLAQQARDSSNLSFVFASAVAELVLSWLLGLELMVVVVMVVAAMKREVQDLPC
jgi:hypothetical protein